MKLTLIMISCFQRQSQVLVNPLAITSIQICSFVNDDGDGYYGILRTIDQADFFISEDDYNKILKATTPQD